jgi:tetratricopeptide (TPR) repeat protein
MNSRDDDKDDGHYVGENPIDPDLPEAFEDLFTGSRDEFDAAAELTDRFSTHPAQYKLSFDFNEQLRPVPHSSEDMERFSAILVAQARILLEDIVWPQDLPSEKPVSKSALQEKLVSSLGQAGALQSILGHLDQAEIYLSSVLEYADTFDCNDGIVVQQWLRYSDVLLLQKEFAEAEQGFRDALKMIDSDLSLAGFRNFALQHLAKNYFDQKKYTEAAELFKEALNLRQQKPNKDLIASSELGLKRSLELAQEVKK